MTKDKKPELTWAFIKPQLKAKARADAAFRARLLANPAEAVREVIGHSLPEGVQITPVEESDDSLYIVVPRTSASTPDPVRVVDADDWALILNDGEDCPGDGNPTDPCDVPGSEPGSQA